MKGGDMLFREPESSRKKLVEAGSKIGNPEEIQD